MTRAYRPILSLLAFLGSATAIPAYAVVTACVSSAGVEGLCSTSSGTCTVASVKNVQAGVTIDCSGRDIVVTGTGTKITVSNGAFTLKAKNLTLQSGRSILVNEHSTTRTGVRIELSESLTVSGDILARNGGGGSFVDIVAGGLVTFDGSNPVVALDGTVQNADGGDLVVNAAGSIRVAKLIDASGKAGGTSANQNGGGDVVLASGADILIDAEVRSFGRWFNGGNVSLQAVGDVIISYVAGTGQPKGQIVADGRSTDGDGGSVSIVAGDQVKIEGPINVAGGTNASGGEASGGSVDVRSGCGGILLTESIDATGGWSGGDVSLLADGGVTISDVINLEARQGNGGGGRLVVDTPGSIAVTNGAWVTAWGHAASVHDGSGGRISLTGCTVDVQGGAILEAIGHRGGLIELRGRGAPADQTAPSIKVATSSVVDAGEMGIGQCEADGRILLDVRSPAPGVCSNALSQSCTSRASCSGTSECINPPGNPNTGNVLTQFYPAPRKRLRPEMLACNSPCS